MSVSLGTSCPAEASSSGTSGSSATRGQADQHDVGGLAPAVIALFPAVEQHRVMLAQRIFALAHAGDHLALQVDEQRHIVLVVRGRAALQPVERSGEPCRQPRAIRAAARSITRAWNGPSFRGSTPA